MFQSLIVDDDKNTRHYLSTVLADAGYTPYTASSASEALLRRIYRMIATVAPVEEEDIVCVPFMKENLYLAVPEDHELSGYRKLYLKDLKDLTIILHSRIGFWYDLCMREMVNPDFILQDDFDQFQILSRSTLLPYFVTDVSKKRFRHAEGQIMIRILDPEANVTNVLLFLSERK